jgi:hypothetical protein
LLADDSVEDGEELSGDGDDGDQPWFSCVEEALMEAPERGVVAGGDQSVHVEGGAHLRPAAADEAFAFPLAVMPESATTELQGGATERSSRELKSSLR